MTEPWGYLPSCAAEFPNDNPALHDGVSWVCLTVSGRPRPVVRARLAAPVPVSALAEVAGGLDRAATERGREAPAADVAPPMALAEVAEAETSAAPEADDEAVVAAAVPLIAFAEVAEAETSAAPEADDEAVVAEAVPLIAFAEVIEAEGRAVPAAEEGREPVEAVLGTAPAPVAEAEDPKGEADLEVTLAPTADAGRHSDEVVLTPESEPTAGATAAAPFAFDAEGGEVANVSLVNEVEAAEAPPCEEEPAAPFAFDAEGGEVANVSPVNDPLAAAAPVEARRMEPPELARTPEDPTDAYTAFVEALVQVSLASGATRAAAVLPSLLGGAAVEFTAFSDETRRDLATAQILGAGAGASDGFLATARAWRLVLRGESSDFSGCGASTLDSWSADLLKAFGVGQGGKLDVRRELRRRGVAAFGMLLAA